MMVFPNTNPDKDWPFDNRYVCTCCRSCGSPYFGPKRSPSCWSCADDTMKQWWYETNNKTKDRK